MMGSMSARPGMLVEPAGYITSNDALKWKDLELYMVKHLEYPTCQTRPLKVKHKLNKGKRNKVVASVFTYTERNDNLALCVIQDILELAILDYAFASEEQGQIRKEKVARNRDEQHRDFFDNIGNKIVINGNYHRKPIVFEPDTSHVIPERKALADLEFKNRDVDKVSDEEPLEDRIRSIEMRLALHRLDVPKPLQKRIRFDETQLQKALRGHHSVGEREWTSMPKQKSIHMLAKIRYRNTIRLIDCGESFQRVARATTSDA
ncbi:uncharacterized protein ATNIH1004_000102 [Aspergillus tanneri]|uniref:Uncharacterized protein n=1 Tax=Aspergillus tanneri TaxID=1220188 RepID=A0A5M9N0U4_9EURO|nr:uncharacterized protein ATNIH1004_000102 [Aspergillus tanneri]KAA8651224.1 hypothetical protein ATNIH1004_000102 [Aspergillus tanneri]